MKNNQNKHETLSLADLAAARKDTALWSQQSKTAANDIANLCAKASKAAQQVPHAGVGRDLNQQTESSGGNATDSQLKKAKP